MTNNADECTECGYVPRLGNCTDKECEKCHKKCDNDCGTVLDENEHVFCLSKGDEEMTWCQTCFDDCGKDARENGWVFDEQGEQILDEEEVDDYDSPNVYPYKACHDCGERKSCGSYSEHVGYTAWFCENCHADAVGEDGEEEDAEDEEDE
jgi:hypothetical protein